MALSSPNLLTVLQHWERYTASCAASGQLPDVSDFAAWLTARAAPIVDPPLHQARHANTVVLHVWRLARLVRRTYRQRCADAGLASPEEFMLLYAACKAPAPGLSKTALFRLAVLEAPTGGQMLARLVGQGLLVEVPDAADGRVRRVVATPAGQAAFHQTATEFDALNQAVVAGLAPRELTQLATLLGYLVAQQPTT